MVTASICTIGDEILIGQIVDTNSARISSALGEAGVRVMRMVSIGDDHGTILASLEEELRRCQVVVTTGGLGPTKDDITKLALAELSGSRKYVEHHGQLAKVYEILHSRGLEVLDINKAQALVPDTCEVIVNQKGTAPIMVFRFPASRFGHEAVLYAMPGVPFETEAALPDVVKDICGHFPIGSIYHRTIMTYGLAESALSKLVEPWEDALPEDMHLAYLPNPLTGVRLRLSSYGGDPEVQRRRLDAEIGVLRGILGDYMYSDVDDTLQARIGRILAEKSETLCVAESCTGGMISELITSVPGSSRYYLGSVTSYNVSVKESILGVNRSVVDSYGVVSEEVARAMAEGARAALGADWAIATTGNAGPGVEPGGQPSGLVWVAVSSKRGTVARSFVYRNDRRRNIERFSASALNLLRLELEAW